MHIFTCTGITLFNSENIIINTCVGKILSGKLQGTLGNGVAVCLQGQPASASAVWILQTTLGTSGDGIPTPTQDDRAGDVQLQGGSV